MVSDIEFLETVCERMQEVGLVQSKAEFSTRMLGKGPSYLTSMSARDRKVPDEVMVFLMEQLQHGVADDDVALAELHEEARRCGYERKHRIDMLESVASHRKTGSLQGPQLHQISVTSLPLGQRLVRWLRQSCIAWIRN